LISLRKLHENTPEGDSVLGGGADYGGACARGCRMARGEFVLCDENRSLRHRFSFTAGEEIEMLESGRYGMVIGFRSSRRSPMTTPGARHGGEPLLYGPPPDLALLPGHGHHG